MTQEEKDLLLKDLCARLPYGVKVQHQHQDYLNEVQTIEIISKKYGEIETESVLGFVDDFKPYLFPLSSMTEEQRKEMEENCLKFPQSGVLMPTYKTFDFFNKHHIDFRGLIEKGLAIDATNLNIY